MRLAIAIMVLAGCTRAREQDDAGVAPTWRDDVAPVVAERCVECHAEAASYDLTSYLGALGDGTDDVSNAIAGDAGSELLRVLAQDAAHAAVADVLPLLRAWVIDGAVAYFDSSLHPGGILDPASDGFHGRELAARDWDFPLCQTCHGDDFGGGTSAAACTTCHDDGPTACDTCHEAAPTTGPHPAHLAQDLPCAECHRVPAAWSDAGHILGDLAPAEVQLGALAARDLDPPRRAGPPTYDPASGTCANAYCHGGVFDDDFARAPSPVWTTAGDQASCGGCHGLPPSDHAPVEIDQCARCHPQAAGDHLDGIVELGDGSGTCSACHGDATSPAPPRGLHGELYTTAIAVGGHRAHVEAPSGLRGPVACSACHAMPNAVVTAGHLDSDLPAEVILANGTWDPATATCANNGCHGAATPVWTRVGQGEAACGTCHGVPPADGDHDPDLGVFECVTCHPAFDAGQHMDGDVDL